MRKYGLLLISILIFVIFLSGFFYTLFPQTGLLKINTDF